MIIKTSLNTILFNLLLVYAFLVPLELVLEVLFGIDTVLKPYRVLAILIIGLAMLGTLSQKIRIGIDIREDLFLYLVFIYGLIVTFLSMIYTPFGMSHFFNDAFQVGLYLGMYITLKNLDLNSKRWEYLLWSLVIGICLNAGYIFYKVRTFQASSREAGFMDNANFVALSSVVAIAFLLKRVDIWRNTRKLVISIGALLLLGSVFLGAGSRTSLVVLVLVLSLIYYYSVWWKKALAFLMIGLFGVYFYFYQPQQTAWRPGNALANRIVELDASDDPRFAIWKGALRAAMQTNFMGLGIGQFTHRFPEFFQSENHRVVYNNVRFGIGLSAHSDYFALLTEYGLIGVCLYILFIVVSLVKVSTLMSAHYGNQSLRIAYQFNLIILFSLATFGIASETFLSPLFWILLAISTKTLSS